MLSTANTNICGNQIAQSFQFTALEGIIYGQNIETYDQFGLGVQLKYTSNSGGTMNIPVVKGTPYFTIEFNGDITPAIITQSGFIYTINGSVFQSL